MIAAGPAGLGQTLASLLSPAYPGVTVGGGGPMNASGQILTQVMIGRSQRLMKMTPVTACGANCLVSSSLVMTGQFVQDPTFPGSCFQGGKMYNLTTATATITSETGAPLANVQVSGRFLDDYWTNNPVTGTTNASGVVTWTYKGPCGVGAIAFLVEKATLGTRQLRSYPGSPDQLGDPGQHAPIQPAAGRGVDGQLPARAGAQSAPSTAPALTIRTAPSSPTSGPTLKAGRFQRSRPSPRPSRNPRLLRGP